MRPKGRCTLLNKKIAAAAVLRTAANPLQLLLAAGLLRLCLGPLLLARGFAGVQQDQTRDAVPARQSGGLWEGKSGGQVGGKGV